MQLPLFPPASRALTTGAFSPHHICPALPGAPAPPLPCTSGTPAQGHAIWCSVHAAGPGHTPPQGRPLWPLSCTSASPGRDPCARHRPFHAARQEHSRRRGRPLRPPDVPGNTRSGSPLRIFVWPRRVPARPRADTRKRLFRGSRASQDRFRTTRRGIYCAFASPACAAL